MVAGQPNAGKSMIALYICMKLLELGERPLYFSADSNESTQASRMAAIVTGTPARDVEASLEAGGLAYYEDELADLDLRLDFNSNPSLDDIELTLAAYEEMYGAWPSVIVVDNLMNVEGSGDENEKAGLVEIQKVFKYICRQTGAAIIVLHHCSESEGKPGMPPARKAIQQKVNELPELILTVAYNIESNMFGVAVVKNRHGKADPAAKDPVWLWVDMDRGRFYSTAHEAQLDGVNVQPQGWTYG